MHSIRIVDGTQVFLLFAGYRQIGLACRHKNLDTGADEVVIIRSHTHIPAGNHDTTGTHV